MHAHLRHQTCTSCQTMQIVLEITDCHIASQAVVHLYLCIYLMHGPLFQLTSWPLMPVAILWTSLRTHWLTQSCLHPFIRSCFDSSILYRSCSRGQVRTVVSESLCVCESLTGMLMQASSANLLMCTPLGCCCGRCTPGNDPGAGSTQCKSFSI